MDTVQAHPWVPAYAGTTKPKLIHYLILGEIALAVIPWASSLMAFLLVYRFAPRCKTYWKYVWPGAAAASLLLEASKILFLWHLQNLAVYDRVYGSLTSAIVLLSWAYLSALILVLGAHISARWQGFQMGNPTLPRCSPPGK
ncbi:MAG: YihY/virulence factor BrkB family protein [SAR202 cluster bacterium]|nr:YihY/virulence factor BrkB family protein [SAR202 cluster bacterium]